MPATAIPGTPVGAAEGYVASKWLKDHPIDVKAEDLKKVAKIAAHPAREGTKMLLRRILEDNKLKEDKKAAQKENLLGPKGVDEGDIMDMESFLYGNKYKVGTGAPEPEKKPDDDKDEKKKEKEKENYKPDDDLQKKMNRQDKAKEGLERAGKEIEDPEYNETEAKFEEEFQKLKRKKLNENSKLDPDAYKKQQIKDKIQMNKGRPTEEWVKEDPRVEASKVNRSAAGEEIQYKPEDLLEHKVDPENPTDIKHIKSREFGRAGLSWMTKYLKSILGIGTAAALGANADKAEAEEPANAEEIKKSINDLNDDEKQELLDSLAEAYKNVTSDDASEKAYGEQMFKEIGDQYGIEMPKEETKKKEQIITGDRDKDISGIIKL